MEKVPVSVVIITKNEEKKLPRCLESVRWADEVIVVDGFSADKTAEIASSLGAKVIQHEFSGSFADDRNIGMESARNDWVLQLDADDVVTEGFRINLEEALSKDEGIAVYKFRRTSFFLGHPMKYGGWNHYIPNLVNKKFVKFEGAVHEVPSYKGREAVIEAEIEHHPFDSTEEFIERHNRYTDIAAQELLKTKGAITAMKAFKEMLFKSFKIFWKSYIKKRGYRDGFYGFLFATLFAFSNFLKWAKYWELIRYESM